MKISYFAFDIFYPCENAGCTHVSQITKNLSSHGEVQLFVFPSGRKIINPFLWSENGLNYTRFTMWPKLSLLPLLPSNLISLYSAYTKTKSFQPDIIHERFHSPNPFGQYISKLLKIPRILEVNSPYVEDHAYKSNLAMKLVEYDRKKQFENADAIITQTETLKSIISHVSDTPIYVVPNGVDTKYFIPTDDRRTKGALGLKDEDIIITFNGSFRKWHGVHLLPEISKMVTDKYPNTHFMTLGGSDRNIKNNISPPICYNTLPEFLNISDICISPFSSGKFDYFDKYGFWWNPIKNYEYMSMGKPIVSTNYPELRKTIRDGGLLSEPNDVQGIVNNIFYLIEHESERLRIGERGRQIALKEYDWSKRAKETMEVYNKVI